MSGALLGVLGMRVPAAHRGGRADLTLLAGVIFLTSGIVRVMAAFHEPLFRVPLACSGTASTILGLIVLFDATFVLLGTLVGVYAIVDGVTMMAVGRWRVVGTPESETLTAYETTSVRQTRDNRCCCLPRS